MLLKIHMLSFLRQRRSIINHKVKELYFLQKNDEIYLRLIILLFYNTIKAEKRETKKLVGDLCLLGLILKFSFKYPKVVLIMKRFLSIILSKSGSK